LIKNKHFKNLTLLYKKNSLKKYTFSKKIIEMQQIYDLIYFLLIENSKAITGQNIFLDGNLCNIAQESIIRSK
jgi:enoyl-[acyl-carrier-protein] reductase (NADH)